MRLIADTHILIWFANGDARLSASMQRWIDDPENELFFSLESIREIAIKSSLNKEDFFVNVEDLYAGLLRNSWKELSISASHIFALNQLPALHRDPFDRMLVAQSLVENLILLSVDPVLKRYGVPVLGR